MVVGMTVNHKGIERMRDTADALVLTEKDRAGPVRRELQKVHVMQVRQAFATQGATTLGGKWPAWSPSYAAWRKRYQARWGKKMMVLTGTMKWKFTKPSHRAFVSKWVRPWKFLFGAVDEVASLHQEGRGRLPIRSVVNKTKKDLEQFGKALAEFWKKRIRQVVR